MKRSVSLAGTIAGGMLLALLSGCSSSDSHQDPATRRLNAELLLLRTHQGHAGKACLQAMQDFNDSAKVVVDNQTINKEDPVATDVMEGNRLVAERRCTPDAEALCDEGDTMPPDQAKACTTIKTVRPPRYY